MILVIGSGPAGVACATALVDQGLDVTMLDAGVELEPERRALVDELAGLPPEAWPPASIEALKGGMEVELQGVPLKTSYGSAFPYADVERHLPFEVRGGSTRPTLARGGFSTVWGATALPYAADEFDAWPIDADDLAPHYRAVGSMLDLAARKDDLEDSFPLYADSPRPLQRSPQAAALLRDLNRNRARLRAAGFEFGHSRLAVRAEADERGPGCVYCALCVYGCPYRLIYDAGAGVERLGLRPNFRYVGDVVVERVSERAGRVAVRGRSLANGADRSFEASRVYVACGTVSTTRLLLASLDAYDRPVEMLDSQYFLMPWLRLRSTGDPRSQPRFTLAQAFLELLDERVSPHRVHMQIYTYNELYRTLASQLLGPLWPLLRRPADAVVGRTLLIQGYLHSDHSPSLTASLQRDGDAPRLVLEGRTDADAPQVLRRVVARLYRHWRSFRAVPIGPMLRVAETGRSFHSGGTFPMRETPGELESDGLGRPFGWSRVHVVDSSVFPSIPATTITLSVMANAHRIGSAYHET